MLTQFAPIIIPLNVLIRAKLTKNDQEKSFFPLTENIRKFTLMGYIPKIVHLVLKISSVSLVLCTCEITDMFNTFDDIYLVFKEVNILYIFVPDSVGIN